MPTDSNRQRARSAYLHAQTLIEQATGLLELAETLRGQGDYGITDEDVGRRLDLKVSHGHADAADAVIALYMTGLAESWSIDGLAEATGLPIADLYGALKRRFASIPRSNATRPCPRCGRRYSTRRFVVSLGICRLCRERELWTRRTGVGNDNFTQRRYRRDGSGASSSSRGER